jgi:GWxTD domain-containing protein
MKLLESWAQNPLANAAGWALFHSLWQGALFAMLLALVLVAVRSARARYVATVGALAAILVSFGVTFALLLPSRSAPMLAGYSGMTVRGLAIPEGLSQVPLPQAARGVLPWLPPFWLAGVLLFYMRHLAGCLAAWRLQGRGVCCPAEFWQERVNRLAAHIRVSRAVTLLESSLAGVPVVIGHLRPVILMPVGLLAGLPPEQIESILLHELAHIRRWDYLVNVVQRLVEGFLFYHPLVWWISSVIRAEREHCCDDLAVAMSGNAGQYAAALTALEQVRCGPQAALAATGGNLVKRIRRLLIPSEGPSLSWVPFCSAVILTIAAAVGVSAWQAKTPEASAQPKPKLIAQAQTTPAPAPPPAVSPYTKWLEEDVRWIITSDERDAFLKLQTDGERSRFIEQFWLRRDPTPGTPENEFKEEHYRRLRYANDHFTSKSGIPGWKTDRGRIYVVFGPPDERDEHPTGGTYARPPEEGGGETTTIPFEDWRYRYIEGIGNNVMMEFVDPTLNGEYHMTMDPAEKERLGRDPAVRYVPQH